MDDIMVDIETLGTGSNAMIVQIAAVRFDPFGGDCGLIQAPEFAFDFHVQPTGNAVLDGVMDFDTVRWWLSQEERARQRVFAPVAGCGGHVGTGVMALSHWLREQGPFERVWASGPQFDLALLKAAFDRTLNEVPVLRTLGADPGPRPWPIPFRAERDFRTLKHVGKLLGVEKPLFVGVEHDALDDCYHQAGYAIQILRRVAACRSESPNNLTIPESAPGASSSSATGAVLPG
jgi:hypothetical protein